MGDKRLYFDEDKNKQYYLDENGNRVYIESDLPAKSPAPSVKVAVISGVFAIIVAIIGIIPLFPRETLSGETELVPAFCLLLNSQIVNSILNCGNQNRDIEIAVAATLTANAPTLNPVETSVSETLTALAPTQTSAEPTARIVTATSEPNTIRCLSYNQLATLGNILQRLESPPGMLSGLQIAFTQDWTAPNGWVIHRNSVQVQSVIAGDVASVWSPEVCRPLDNSAPTPTLTPVVAQSVMSSCPGYPNMPYWASGVARSRAEMVVIPDGQIAFIDTWGLSIGQQNWSGGVFVIIRGPFSAEITITDGAFCGGIDSDANYEPLRQQRLSQLTNKNIIPTFIELP